MPDYNIVHNADESRFETEVDGSLAVVDYVVDGKTMSVIHTGVPKELEGRGIAAALTKVVLEYADKNSLELIPVCSYTKSYIERHSK